MKVVMWSRRKISYRTTKREVNLVMRRRENDANDTYAQLCALTPKV